MITAADALAFCLAQPGADAVDCRDAVSSQLVGGVYCDGDVLAVVGQPKRCIPSAALERKRAAAAKTPLPRAATSSSSPASSSSLLAIGAIVVVVGALAFFASTRD